MMGCHKALHWGKSFRASHVSVRGFNVILKRVRCHSGGGRSILRKNFPTYNILQRGVSQTKKQVEENATVMKNDRNQYSIWKYNQTVKPVKFDKGKVVELGGEIKHWRDKYISKVLSLYDYKKCSLFGKHKK